MTTFLYYDLKAAVLIAVFYIFYRLLLSKETFHRMNRIVLLSTALLSFILPLCIITTHRTEVIAGASPVIEVLEGAPAVVPGEEQTVLPWWLTAIVTAYLAGVAVVITKILISLVSILRLIRSAQDVREYKGSHLIIRDTKSASFSWMNYIIIGRNDYEQGIEEILDHEKAHIGLRHSWDLLLVDLISAVQWFNPTIWMLRSDLRAIHEYEADEAVLLNGADVRHYQYLLVSKAMAESGFSITNQFNHSNLKSRINMMTNKKSHTSSALKALYILPIVGVSLAVSAETIVDYEYTISAEPIVTVGKQTPDPATSQTRQTEHKATTAEAAPVEAAETDIATDDIRNAGKEQPLNVVNDKTLPDSLIVGKVSHQDNDSDEVFLVVEQMPEFKGGMMGLMEHMRQSLRYPDLAKRLGLQGRVIVQFTIGKQGDVYDVSIAKAALPENPESYEAPEGVTLPPAGQTPEQYRADYNTANQQFSEEAIRCLKSTSGLWTPGKQRGEPVNVKYTIPIMFRLQ